MILAYYLRDTKGVFSTPSIESGSINISSISIVSTRLAACARVQLSRALSSAKKPESPIDRSSFQRPRINFERRRDVSRVSTAISKVRSAGDYRFRKVGKGADGVT